MTNTVSIVVPAAVTVELPENAPPIVKSFVEGEAAAVAVVSAAAAVTAKVAAQAAMTEAQAAAAQLNAEVLELGLKLVQIPSLQVNALQSFDRYVDTRAIVNGTGLSPNSPKQTFAQAVAMGPIAGASIGVARGSVVRSINVLTGDSIRVGSYGPLGTPQPVFDPSIPLVSTSWAPHATYAGIWAQGVTGGFEAGDGSLKNIGNVVWLDQSTGDYFVLKQYASEAALNAAPSGVYVNAWNQVNMTIHLKPGIYGNPATSAQEYRVTNGYALRIIGNAAHVTDIVGQNAAEQNGAIDLGEGSSGCFAARISCLNGSRHNSLFGPNSVVEDSYFAGGDNQLEAGQGGNSVVFFTNNFAGKTFTARRCTFEDSDGNGVLAILSHDVAPTGYPLPMLVEDCTFIGCYAAVSVQLNNSLVNMTRPVFKDSKRGKINYMVSLYDINCHFAKGRLSMLSDGGHGTHTFYDSDLDIVDMGGGARQSIFQSNYSTGAPTYRIVRGTYRIDSNIRGYSGHAAAVAAMNAGHFHAENATFKMKGQFHAGQMTHGWQMGIAGGVGVVSGGNNRWPYGIQFELNGTTYASLAAAQVAGYEIGSTTEAIPTPVVSRIFTATPNGNLEGVAGWTKLAGNAGAWAVTANKVGPAFAATAAYKTGDIPAEGGYVKFIVEGFGDWVFATQKMSANGDTYLGVAAWSDQKLYVTYVTPTVTNFAVYIGPSVAIGDEIMLVTRVSDRATGKMDIFLYRNGAMVRQSEYINPAMMDNTGVGFASVGYNVAGVLARNIVAGPLV